MGKTKKKQTAIRSKKKQPHVEEKRIAIFASGSGTNAEAIINYFSEHGSVHVVAVYSNNPEAYVLERARKYKIPTRVFSKVQFRDTEEVLEWLDKDRVTHIVLAGFMWLVPAYLIDRYPDKIINIHPALLPKYGGKGMYGMRVHEAVKAAGETKTGISIHLVNARYDEGALLFQARCHINAELNAEQIAVKVHQLEYAFYPPVIERWAEYTS